MSYFRIKTKRTRKRNRNLNSLIFRYYAYCIMSLFLLICLTCHMFVFYYKVEYDSIFYDITAIYLSLEFIVFFILRITEPFTSQYIILKFKYYLTPSIIKQKKYWTEIVQSEEWLIKTTSLFMLLQSTLCAQVCIYIYIYISYR